MVRSSKGIELMLNLVNISYSVMKILPYQYPEFSEYRNQSVKDFWFALEKWIREDVFLWTFEKNSKKQFIYSKYWLHYFPSRIINNKTCKVVFISIREYYFWISVRLLDKLSENCPHPNLFQEKSACPRQKLQRG